MKIDFTPTIKQQKVFDLFCDSNTTEVLYGGGVGSAKTYLLATLAIEKCLTNKGIRVGLARNELTTLKKTTAITFFEVFENWNLKRDQHFTYNSTEGSFKFKNGSEIIFSELRFLPGDPDFTRLGGLLLTFALIDEAGECDKRGKEIYQSRVGRWKNEKFNIKPFLVMTCNPSRNFLFDDFYFSSKEGKMPPHRAFINATAHDNPYIPQSYIDNLKRTLSLNEQQRLLFGNWEFDGNPDNLLELSDIKCMYEDVPDVQESSLKYISADIAFTSDRCVIMVWDGLTIIEIIIVKSGENVEEKIKEAALLHKVNQNRISYDSDGVGKFLMNYLKQARPIVNNARAIGGENYKNLKTQLYFKLVELIKSGQIKIIGDNYKREIEEELISIRNKPKETTEGKIEMNSKSDVKRLIGRSPDFADTMAYRMVFEIKQAPKRSFIIN